MCAIIKAAGTAAWVLLPDTRNQNLLCENYHILRVHGNDDAGNYVAFVYLSSFFA